MKSKFRHGLVALAMISACNFLPTAGFAQGSLAPPGAPAPTMKSLDQVEPRTIVNAANTPGDANDLFNLSLPGSYYLTTNITGVSGKNGIEITANNVTLDLNGFAVLGVSGSSNGIWIPNAGTNITIRGGAVSGWGVDGITNTSPSAVNLVCEQLSVSANTGDGISLNGSGVVRDCNIQKNSRHGINNNSGGFFLITGCDASGNLLNGFLLGLGCNVKDCLAGSNGIGGIVLGDNCSVQDCVATGNLTVGISVPDNCTLLGCTADGNGLGIFVKNNCIIKDCVVDANTQGGIDVFGNNCQVTGNTCSANSGYGIQIVGGQNRIDDNSVGNNSLYGIFPNNSNVINSITRNSSPGAGYGNYPNNSDYAPIGGPNTSTNPWQNFQ